MSLRNEQIERYSRQIIVPGMGGTAQEHLLSARLLLAGNASDVALVLPYMVGAGVGNIRLRLPPSDSHEQDSLIMAAAELNPEVVVKPQDESEALNLVLAFGNSEILNLMQLPALLHQGVPIIQCRLDDAARIVIFPRFPPCPLCADTDPQSSLTQRSDKAGFVAMVAATEAFKLLAKATPTMGSMLLQFNGFAVSTRKLQQRPLHERCLCSTTARDGQGF
jgi:hypothetical protein